MKRFRERWMQYWLPTDSGMDLAVCRIIVVGVLLLFFMPTLEDQLAYLSANSRFRSPRFLVSVAKKILSEPQLRSESFVTAIWWITVLSAATTTVGLFSRSSAALLMLSYGYLISHRYSYGELHHPEALLLIFLMILPLSPCGTRLSIDAWHYRRRTGRDPPPTRFAVWPLRLTAIVIGLVYFDSAYAKLNKSGLGWANGYTLQYNVLYRALWYDLGIGLWLSDQHNLLRVLSVYSLVVEGLFWTGLIWRRLVPLWLVSGFLFHFGNVLTRGEHLDFMSWCLLYCVFIPFEKIGEMPRVRSWLPRLSRLVRSGRSPPQPVGEA